MPTDTGYCTIQDVSDVLQDKFQGADPAPRHAKTAILGENEWVRKTTHRHWYDPGHEPSEFRSSGVTLALPTEPRTVTDETQDIPASPHPQQGQLVSTGEERHYPQTHRGRHCRVRLDRRHADTLDALRVRRRDEYHEWTADAEREQGRAQDYYLSSDPHTGRSAVYLDSRTLPAMLDYSGAVVVNYQYGDSPIPHSVRRAVALRAAAELVTDEDANVQIPESAMVMSVETKAQELRDMAEQKLDPYRATPVA